MNNIVTAKRTQMEDDKAFSELIDPCKEKLYRIDFVYFKKEQSSLDSVSEAIYEHE